MGSDSTKKSADRRDILRRRLRGPPAPMTICLLLLTLLVVIFWMKTENSSTSLSFDPDDMSHLPTRCSEVARQFQECQQQTNVPPVVFACHRKWCHSYGHCEPCAGIGDRSYHMLSMVHEASLKKCIPVKLDYPLVGVQQVVSNAVYHDSGIVNEVLHRRSYDVTPRTINTSQWGKQESFVHFTPTHYTAYSSFDPCLFHVLFRTAPQMQKEIDYHKTRMGDNAIGIHLRSGDMAAFGFDNQDVRASSADMETAVSKMLTCAQQHADKLFPKDEPCTFFFASDNEHAKEVASSIKLDPRFHVYQTKIRPSAYFRSDGERDAWLELYLLSMMDGLVVNVRPKHYEGHAMRLSFFSVMAKLIGFIPDEHVMECVID